MCSWVACTLTHAILHTWRNARSKGHTWQLRTRAHTSEQWRRRDRPFYYWKAEKSIFSLSLPWFYFSCLWFFNLIFDRRLVSFSFSSLSLHLDVYWINPNSSEFLKLICYISVCHSIRINMSIVEMESFFFMTEFFLKEICFAIHLVTSNRQADRQTATIIVKGKQYCHNRAHDSMGTCGHLLM